MLEILAYKKYKKNQDEKADKEKQKQIVKDEATAATAKGVSNEKPVDPVLTDDDELFFERLTLQDGYTDEAGKRPPLPPRVKTPDISWGSDDDESHKGVKHDAAQGPTKSKGNVFDRNDKWKKAKGLTTAFFVRKNKDNKKDDDGSEPNTHLAVPEAEEEREKDDISRVLDDLNFSAKNNKTFSLSQESAEMVGQFTVVLKDLVNGVPTAGNDLKALLDDHDGILAKNYEKLPKSMQKMVTTLPNKLTSTLAPELLAVAAEAQGSSNDVDASKGGLKEQAMKLIVPRNMTELITKPSAIIGMLKAIVNALKLRWPAFIGTNVIMSIALSLLLFVLWYCHKRGREVRLERERLLKEAEDERSGHVEELSDGSALLVESPGVKMLSPPEDSPAASSSKIERASSRNSKKSRSSRS